MHLASGNTDGGEVNGNLETKVYGTTNEGGHNLQIAVVGGGIVGVVTALGLLSRDISVKIYEQARSLREIGAGVAFTTNAQRCMELVDPSILRAMKAVSTENPSAYYQYVDGFHSQSSEPHDTREKELFRLYAGNTGFDGCHRAALMDQLVKLLPEGVVEFHKKLATCETGDDGIVNMHFEDGTTAKSDAVIGCDGIKSRVKQILVGKDDPAAYPTYTHKVAFRGLVQMEKAITALGDKATNQCMHMGPKAHILNFPIAQGTLMNVVAFATDDQDWLHEKMTAPATKEEVMEVFKDWAPAVRSIASLLEDSLDRWAIFDTYDHPMPFYSKGMICVAGDAAHACAPHHGAGAGFGVEDALALATVMEEVQLTLKNQAIEGSSKSSKHAALTAAFRAYDAARRERSQWLVQSARGICDTYEWADPNCGSDPKKCHDEIEWRAHKIWYFDIEGMRKDARTAYQQFLCT